MRALITGSGNMGQPIAAALTARGDEVAACAAQGRAVGRRRDDVDGDALEVGAFALDRHLLDWHLLGRHLPLRHGGRAGIEVGVVVVDGPTRSPQPYPSGAHSPK